MQLTTLILKKIVTTENPYPYKIIINILFVSIYYNTPSMFLKKLFWTWLGSNIGNINLVEFGNIRTMWIDLS